MPNMPATCLRHRAIIVGNYASFWQMGLNHKDCAFRYILPIKSVLFRILRFCVGQSCGLYRFYAGNTYFDQNIYVFIE